VRAFADERGVNVLVARGELLHGVDVHAAFVGECRRADPRLARVVARVRDFIHELRKLLQLSAMISRARSFFQFQGDARDDGWSNAIARAFAVAVDGALHMNCAGRRARPARSQRRGRCRRACGCRLCNSNLPTAAFVISVTSPGKTTAVGVAKHDEIRAGLFGGLPGGNGVFGSSL